MKGRLSQRGRWTRLPGKRTTQRLLRLDIAEFDVDFSIPRAGHIHWQSGAGITFFVLPGQGVQLAYQHKGIEIDPYLLPVVWTQPHYGGRRPWWLCPSCRRRCRVVYGDRYFACRRCQKLAYPSQNATDLDALYSAANKRIRAIRRRLGAPTGAFYEATKPGKPKGMHAETFRRLHREYLALMCFEQMVRSKILLNAVGEEPKHEINLAAAWHNLTHGDEFELELFAQVARDIIRQER